MAQAVAVPTPRRVDFTGASPSRSTIDAYRRSIGDLAKHRPSPIPLIPSGPDLESWLSHHSVLAGIARYLTVALGDNVPGSLDPNGIEALRADLLSEVIGTLQKAAHPVDAGGRR